MSVVKSEPDTTRKASRKSAKTQEPDSSVVREAQDWLCDRKLVDITDILR